MRSQGNVIIRNINTMIVVFGIVLLSFIWGGLYGKVQSERQLELDTAYKDTAQYARVFAEHTTRTVRGLDEIALFLKRQAEMEGLNIDIPRLVEAGRFAGQPFLAIGIVDENGDLTASSQVPLRKINNRDLEVFQAQRDAVENKLIIGKPLIGRASGQQIFQISQRINKADGSFGGAVIVGVDPGYFAAFYQQVDLGEQSLISLLGRDGNVRVRQSGNDIRMGVDLQNQLIMDKLAANHAGTFIQVSPVDGIKRIMSYHALDDYPLVVMVGMTETEVFANLNHRVTSYVLICGLMSGVIILFVGLLLMGIRQRKQAETARRESEQRFSNAFKYAAIGMALISPAGQWIKVNTSLCQLLGYSAEELLGKTVVDLTHADDRQVTEEFHRQVLHGDVDSFQLEKRYYHHAGHIVWVLVLVSLVRNDDREPLYLIAQIEDITDRKRLEQELRVHAETLEETVVLRTQELNASNQELMAANQELLAMNEEVLAVNETLAVTNQALDSEITVRKHAEQAAIRREKQYHATANLLTRPGEDLDGLLQSILYNAITLIGAPAGYIVLLDDKGEKFVLRHKLGSTYKMGKSQPVELGLLGQLYRTGELALVEDYRQYDHRVADPDFDTLTTLLMVPLKFYGKVQGALAAHWNDDIRLVTDDDKEIYRQFGTLASLAIERVYAGARISRQNELLQELAKATASLVEELDLEKALQHILDKASSFMAIRHGFIQLFDSDGEYLTFKCGLGRFAGRQGYRLRFAGKGVFGEVLRTGRLVVIDDYSSWPQQLVNEDTVGMTAVVQAPLNVDGKTIGSIGLASYGEPIASDREKLILFEQYATIAAVTIRNLMTHHEINRLAYYDLLTGLPNRVHLNMHLEEEMAKARHGDVAGAVMYIDLDDLKTVNDHLGHTYGDSVIAAAGHDIVAVAGKDAYVARAGGDEFVVILPGADFTKIASVADQLIMTVCKEYDIKSQRIQMSASIGITLYPVDAVTVEDILKNADIAMYAAKGSGKNNWRMYEQAMRTVAYDNMVLTNSLRRALENDELYLHYQPQIALPDRKIVGFEALLRWNSKEHGIVSPARFIPLAEQKDLIRPIGQWVITEACQFARGLADLGHKDIHVAVNISPRQLAAADFVAMMRRCIDEAGIAPKQLEVEITESVLIDSLADSINKLNELRAVGIRVSLDDFGTGYSSLTYLRNLPVETLKIDKSFIDRLLNAEEEAGFIKSIISMAHVLKLNVVAEGVETEAQLMKLFQLECDSVQGYVFSKPISSEEALRLIL